MVDVVSRRWRHWLWSNVLDRAPELAWWLVDLQILWPQLGGVLAALVLVLCIVMGTDQNCVCANCKDHLGLGVNEEKSV